MTQYKYILNKDHTITQTEDILVWAKWFEKMENRRIAETEMGQITVSTVFLGIDHRFSNKGKPILFESMVFKNSESIDEERYCTYEEAERGHENLVNVYKVMN